MSEAERPTNVLQALSDAGINPFGVMLMCESLLKHPKPIPLDFEFPIRRSDCPGWLGVRVRLDPVPDIPAQDVAGVPAKQE